MEKLNSWTKIGLCQVILTDLTKTALSGAKLREARLLKPAPRLVGLITWSSP